MKTHVILGAYLSALVVVANAQQPLIRELAPTMGNPPFNGEGYRHTVIDQKHFYSQRMRAQYTLPLVRPAKTLNMVNTFIFQPNGYGGWQPENLQTAHDCAVPGSYYNFEPQDPVAMLRGGTVMAQGTVGYVLWEVACK